jgi:N-acetyl-anhydromuramyl-L-alanine amidase AmpD
MAHVKLFESWLSDLAATAKRAFTGEVEAEERAAEVSDATFMQDFEREIIDISGKADQPKMEPGKDLDKYFVVHHTAGHGRAEDVVNILNDRGLGVQWIIDREGKVYRSFPEGMTAWHTGHQDQKDAPSDLQNQTAQGVEVVAKNDRDVLPVQILAAFKLLKYLGYTKDQVWGHGEVTYNKQASEGETITDFWRNHSDKSPEEAAELIAAGTGMLGRFKNSRVD